MNAVPIIFGVVTIAAVIRAGRDVKRLLSSARSERSDINRNLEKVSHRIKRIDDQGEKARRLPVD